MAKPRSEAAVKTLVVEMRPETVVASASFQLVSLGRTLEMSAVLALVVSTVPTSALPQAVAMTTAVLSM